jgi:hypothetical protein
VLAASYWYTYKVVKDYVEGPVKDPDRLDRADQFWVLAFGGLLPGCGRSRSPRLPATC